MFNTTHDRFREETRQFFKENFVPFRKEWELSGTVPKELWLKAGKKGLLSVGVPTKHGGTKGDFLKQVVIIEEQMYANASGPSFAVHSSVVAPYFFRYGTDEQKKKYLKDICSGKLIAALAVCEGGVSGDIRKLRTRAWKNGDDWVLAGSKCYVPNGVMCDVVIVAAVTDTLSKDIANSISLFIVETGTIGCYKSKPSKNMGLRRLDMANMNFNEMRVPKSALLGTFNMGFAHLMRDIKLERLLYGIGTTANLEGTFEKTRYYVKKRLSQLKEDPNNVYRSQIVQHKLAEMKIEVCAARAFTDQCITMYITKELDDAMAAMLKYWSTDQVNKIAYEAVQILSSNEYMEEYELQSAYAEARVQSLYVGTAQVLKEILARKIVAQVPRQMINFTQFNFPRPGDDSQDK